MNRIYKLLIVAACSIGVLASCKKSDDSSPSPSLDSTTAAPVIADYAQLVYLSYQDSYDKAVLLQKAIKTFTDAPSAGTLEAAKQAWFASRLPYGQTEGFRFSGGPIDDGDDAPEGRINSWPVDESYIDYTFNSVTNTVDSTGVINSKEAKYATINEDLIISLNGSEAEEEVTTGYHAIEFLLWGQDLTAPADNKPGQRPLTDYTTEANAQRRKDYLNAAASLLVKDLKTVLDQWKADGDYRKAFLALPVEESMKRILTGIFTLSSSELPVERMAVALKAHDQENEHSCFSDNTDKDILMNATSINNVYFCKYIKTDGTTFEGKSIASLVNSKDATLEATIVIKMANALLKAGAIQHPFDNEISSTNGAGNVRVQEAIDAIDTNSKAIQDAAKKLGITIAAE